MNVQRLIVATACLLMLLAPMIVVDKSSNDWNDLIDLDSSVYYQVQSGNILSSNGINWELSAGPIITSKGEIWIGKSKTPSIVNPAGVAITTIGDDGILLLQFGGHSDDFMLNISHFNESSFVSSSYIPYSTSCAGEHMVADRAPSGTIWLAVHCTQWGQQDHLRVYSYTEFDGVIEKFTSSGNISDYGLNLVVRDDGTVIVTTTKVSDGGIPTLYTHVIRTDGTINIETMQIGSLPNEAGGQLHKDSTGNLWLCYTNSSSQTNPNSFFLSVVKLASSWDGFGDAPYVVEPAIPRPNYVPNAKGWGMDCSISSAPNGRVLVTYEGDEGPGSLMISTRQINGSWVSDSPIAGTNLDMNFLFHNLNLDVDSRVWLPVVDQAPGSSGNENFHNLYFRDLNNEWWFFPLGEEGLVDGPYSSVFGEDGSFWFAVSIDTQPMVLFRTFLDSDSDGTLDVEDPFPEDPTQWKDMDGDGFGDQPSGTTGDDCLTIAGTSNQSGVFGCPDSDGDNYADFIDAFITEPTQWSDRDGDGFGDNPDGILSDAFPIDSTQWHDSDEDGFGDNMFSNGGDSCISVAGTSFLDRFGCLDSDNDGISDLNDGFPLDNSRWLDTDGDQIEDEYDVFPFNPSQWLDSDGDGFGDNNFGSNADNFPQDPSQWNDIDGDGYGDNQTGSNPDAFIADPTQWHDADNDGHGDNIFGRNADMFPEDPTQWEDQDGDGWGDNQSGNNPDPYLFDYDNDGYNDSIDVLPMLASPGDLDNDGCIDEVDNFPADFHECMDNDGDGLGDMADNDDDNDGWSDTVEIREGTNPLNSNDYPIAPFEVMIPGTGIGLSFWSLIGLPLSILVGYGFITRNWRTRRFEEKLRSALSPEELLEIVTKSENALRFRLIAAHQCIRIERLRAELSQAFGLEMESSSIDQTMLTEQEGTNTIFPPIDAEGIVGEDGYEWLEHDGQHYFRSQDTEEQWKSWDN